MSIGTDRRLVWPDRAVYTITRSSEETGGSELVMECATARARSLGHLRGIRSLLYIAMRVDDYPEHSRAPSGVLNALVPFLAPLGRLLGLRTA